MKKLFLLAALAIFAVACDDDSAPDGGEETTELIAPALYMDVVTSDGNKPFTHLRLLFCGERRVV